MSVGDHDKNWMNELKDGEMPGDSSPMDKYEVVPGVVVVSAKNPAGYFSGVFKFQVGEKVRSRIHECEGIIEYSEFTRFISGDEISYKIRFNDPEDMKTDSVMVEEHWLEKI